MVKHTLWAGWWSLVIGAVLAIILSAIRFAFPLLGQYKPYLEDQIGQFVGTEVSIAELNTGWNGPFPRFEVKGFNTQVGDALNPLLEIKVDSVSFEINPWQSLIDLAPIFQKATIDGVNVKWSQQQGLWTFSSGEQKSVDPDAMALLALLVLEQPEILVTNAQLHLKPDSGRSRFINLDQMQVESSETEHQLSGQFWMPVLGKDTRMDFALRYDGKQDSGVDLFPFYLKLNHLGPELPALFNLESNLSSMSADAELWGTLRGAALQSLNGQIRVADFVYGDSNNGVLFSEVQSNFSLQSIMGDYQLFFDNLTLAQTGDPVTIPPIAIDIHKGIDGWVPNRVQLPSLSIDDLWSVTQYQPLPEKMMGILRDMNPQGSLSAVSVDLSGGLGALSLSANLDNVSINPWHGVPGVQNLNGTLALSPKGGKVEIGSNNTAFHFASVYEEALMFDQVNGSVRWSLDDVGARVSADHLNIVMNGFDANGAFAIDLPYESTEQAMFNLAIGLRGAKARDALTLTPKNVVGEKLYTWMETALISGEVPEAGLVLVTPTRDVEDRPTPLSELYVITQDAQLDYQSPWPQLEHADSVVHIRDGDVRVQLQQGIVASTEVAYGEAYKSQGLDELSVDLSLNGFAFPLNTLLRSGPLNESVGKSLTDWQISGAHQSLVQLSLPLSKGEPTILVDSKISGGIFASQSNRIAVTDIAGELKFDNRKGLSANSLSAHLLGRPVTADIKSSDTKTEVEISGRMDSTYLLHWVGAPLEQIITGEIPLFSRLTLCKAKGCSSSLQIESNLVGTTVDAPAYLYHDPKDKSRLSLLVSLDKGSQLQLNYADRLRGDLSVGSSLSGNLRIGGKPASGKDVSGLLIDGQLPELDLSELLTFLANLTPKDSNSSEPLKVTSEVTIDKLVVSESIAFEGIHSSAHQQEGAWVVSLDGKPVQGVINYQPVDNAMAINFKHLVLTTPESETDVVEPEIPLPEPTDPSLLDQIPQGAVTIDRLVWNGEDWGRWQANISPKSDRVVLEELTADVAGINLAGEVQWILYDERTELNLTATGKSLGNYLEAMGDPRFIETKELSGAVDLKWPGAPWSFSKYRLSGPIKFDLRNGQLTEAKGNSDLLRLFSILNFDALFRRLKLDFSDLYKQGISFDKLIGNYQIDKGVAHSSQPLLMRGPSTDMKAEGSIDLIHKTLDKRVDIILPLVGTTPLAAVLLGAPQVAGALWLIDKVIGDKINEATKISYTLTGPWSEPALELVERAK